MKEIINNNKKMISLEISDELREQIRVEAFKYRTTMSDMIRTILQQYFNRVEK